MNKPRKRLHPDSVRLTPAQLGTIGFDRVQDEARVAREIVRQHPGVRRDDALRTAADIVRREYRAGRHPA